MDFSLVMINAAIVLFNIGEKKLEIGLRKALIQFIKEAEISCRV
jgi:hypothetical protein